MYNVHESKATYTTASVRGCLAGTVRWPDSHCIESVRIEDKIPVFFSRENRSFSLNANTPIILFDMLARLIAAHESKAVYMKKRTLYAVYSETHTKGGLTYRPKGYSNRFISKLAYPSKRHSRI